MPVRILALPPFQSTGAALASPVQPGQVEEVASNLCSLPLLLEGDGSFQSHAHKVRRSGARPLLLSLTFLYSDRYRTFLRWVERVNYSYALLPRDKRKLMRRRQALMTKFSSLIANVPPESVNQRQWTLRGLFTRWVEFAQHSLVRKHVVVRFQELQDNRLLSRAFYALSAYTQRRMVTDVLQLTASFCCMQKPVNAPSTRSTTNLRRWYAQRTYSARLGCQAASDVVGEVCGLGRRQVVVVSFLSLRY